MKKLFLCLLPLALLGCQKVFTSSEMLSLNYSDFEDNHIEWSEIFNFPLDSYYIYIYSPTCGHCKDIKEYVLQFAYLNIESFYFVTYSSEITAITNVESIIGKDDYQDVGIVGTPTLFLIENHILSNVFTGSKEIIATMYNSD